MISYFGIDNCVTDLHRSCMDITLLFMSSFLLYFQNGKTRMSPAIKFITSADFSGKVTVLVRTASNF